MDNMDNDKFVLFVFFALFILAVLGIILTLIYVTINFQINDPLISFLVMCVWIVTFYKLFKLFRK